MISWKDDLSARERVTTIIQTVSDPVSINWVAEEADVHWNTAESHLEELADDGKVRRVEQGDSTAYVPDFTRAYMEEIRQLALNHSAEELRAELTAAKESIEEIQDQFDVQTREELEQSLADLDITAEETRARSRALRDWEEQQDSLTLVKHALSLQEDLHDVDPYADIGHDGDRDDPRRQEVM